MLPSTIPQTFLPQMTRGVGVRGKKDHFRRIDPKKMYHSVQPRSLSLTEVPFCHQTCRAHPARMLKPKARSLGSSADTRTLPLLVWVTQTPQPRSPALSLLPAAITAFREETRGQQRANVFLKAFQNGIFQSPFPFCFSLGFPRNGNVWKGIGSRPHKGNAKETKTLAPARISFKICNFRFFQMLHLKTYFTPAHFSLLPCVDLIMHSLSPFFLLFFSSSIERERETESCVDISPEPWENQLCFPFLCLSSVASPSGFKPQATVQTPDLVFCKKYKPSRGA